ncbi:uncharacterized protein GLRG_11441 [Colletotrichum graminicola M1.001]|uniref:Major facilitator superfamily (MFS) profile domain-containing protein n=1 Tax=Colletotrichum graminicola (strain M1.001 / M2 / FGSC 10212) TaxID=645133 RepID=E3QZK8_COLGM|nr:uncharacterized protein GLRG_11441 [Colletotrichum graminicola M1.001]EFQ36296.1 hypothetical protein GLRG_11441 [Colletotrichum graminicola M1.001]
MRWKLFSLPWAYLPKDKAAVVAVIASVRVVDFYQIASFQTCMTLHLQYLQPGLSTTELARHVGVAQGMFTAAQVVSAPAWGVAVDKIGRKAVILIGLIATAISCVGVAFAGSIGTIVFWRFLAGATNGTVIAARTAINCGYFYRFFCQMALLSHFFRARQCHSDKTESK